MLLLAAGLLLGLRLAAKPGAAAVVVFPAGETVLSLEREGLYSFEGRNGLKVSVRVEGGRVRFEESGCPDKVCVHAGWLSHTGQSAACLPAGVLLRVEGPDGGVDAVAG